MIVRKWDKKQMQAVLKELRKAGATVTKDGGIYRAKMGKFGKTFLTAMPGRYDYLVRHNEGLFEYKGVA